MKKKLIIATACLLVAALALTGLFWILRMNRAPAKVYPVSEFCTSGDGFGGETMQGTVSTDRMQTVYLSDTQKVTEIYVQDGQHVRQGDPLLHFDTSLTDLSLQRKELEVRQLERELVKLKREYNKLAGSQVYALTAPAADGEAPRVVLLSAPVRGVTTLLLDEPTEPTDEPAAPSDEPTEPTDEPAEPSDEPLEPTDEPTEPTDEPTEPTDEPTEPTDEPTEPTDEPTEPVDEAVIVEPRLISGSGTEEDPYVVAISGGAFLDDALVRELLRGRDEVWVTFAQCEEDRVDGLVCAAWGFRFETEEDGGWSFALCDATDRIGFPLSGPEQPDEPEDPDDPPYVPPYVPGESPAERKERMERLQMEIREKELALHLSETEYARMEEELGDGTICAKFDGVVLSRCEPKQARQTGEPVLKLSGGGGYRITSVVSELQLGELRVGQSVQVTSWYSGGSYVGTVTEISDYPVSNENYWYGGATASYYPITVEVDESADLMDGEYLELRPDSGEGGGGFYLLDAFLLRENGKSYVFVRGEDDRLEKREVPTGGSLWGQYTQLYGGLTVDDYIAFPYAKATEDGAKTTEGSLEELYGWN